MEDEPKERGLRRAPAVILLAIAFLPIVSIGGLPYPSISGKTLFLRGILAMVALFVAYCAWADAEYGSRIKEKALQLWRKPLAKAVLLSYALLVLSSIGAFDRYMAFFSNVERSEGLVGLSFFYLFFFATGIFFEKRQWQQFFTLTLAAGWIVIVIELWEALAGVVRPASLLDNPIYLAGYLLFVAFAGCMVWQRGRRQGSAALVAYGAASAVAAVVGIFVTESRGVIAGGVIGFVATLAYVALSKTTLRGVGRHSLRKTAAGLLAILVLCSGIFLATRHASLWKHIPGVNRVASYSFDEGSTLARGIDSKIAFEAVNPRTMGGERLLLGWGWDNYTYAWQKFYDPQIYAYDTSRFDRAHDKLLDMLSMTGVLGLLAYLLIWAYFMRAVFRIGRRSLFEGSALLLFAVAFFVQNLTGFDTLVTFVFFFGILAYVQYRETDGVRESARPAGAKTWFGIPVVLTLFAFVTFFAFVAYTFVPHMQMTNYRADIQETWSLGNASLLAGSIFSPDTYAQGTIRNDLLNTVFAAYNQGLITAPSPFLDKGIAEMESYLVKHPYLYDDQLELAKAYDVQAQITGDATYLKTGEQHYLAALKLIPNRQTVIYPYAINLAKQDRIPEAVTLLQGAIGREPQILDAHYILGETYALDDTHYAKQAVPEFELALNSGIDLNPRLTVQAYKNFMFDFYDAKDRTDLITVLARLSKIDPSESSIYDAALAKVEASKSVPTLSFAEVQ